MRDVKFVLLGALAIVSSIVWVPVLFLWMVGLATALAVGFPLRKGGA
jgi:hypothetical protein